MKISFEIILWISSIGSVHCIMSISYRRQATDMQTMNQLTMNMDINTRSYIECVAMCSGIPGCQLTSYEGATQMCRLAAYSASASISPTGAEQVYYRQDVVLPVDGHWNGWDPWSSCSVSCGPPLSGNGVRSRTCGSSIWGGQSICPTQGSSSEVGPCSPLGQCAFGDFGVDGHWGNWGLYEECPLLEPIIRFKTKEGSSAEGLTGFSGECRAGNNIHGHDQENVHGAWGQPSSCQDGFSAMEARIVDYQGPLNADPAMICVRLLCQSNSSWYESGECSVTNGVLHGPISCPTGNVFCAVRQRLDHGAVDNSGLNGLRFKCCPDVF